MLVSSVQPVAMRSAVFCMVCSFCVLVDDAMGDHIVEAYSSIGRVMALYVESNVSFCLPHLVEERTLSMGIVLDAFAAMLSMCLL